MRPIYFRKDAPVARMIPVDMPFLATNKAIRFPKYKYEEGLYINYKNKKSGTLEKFVIDKAKAAKEDENFYYFPFPLKDKDLDNLPE